MNWRSFTYRRKMRLLWGGGLLLFVAAFQFSFSKTWQLYRALQKNKELASESQTQAAAASRVGNESKEMDRLIQKYYLDTVNTPKATLAFITSFCKLSRLELIEYQPLQVYEQAGTMVATRQITVKGHYSGLLKLLYELENHQNFGRLCSVTFKSIEEPSTENILLYSTIYLQNIISSK